MTARDPRVDTPIRIARTVAALSIAVFVLSACGQPSEGQPPPVVPGSGARQSVPQVQGMQTFCLEPAGSGLRVFSTQTYGGWRVSSVVDVRGSGPNDPWRCP